MAKSIREQIAAQQTIIDKAMVAKAALETKLGNEVDPAALVTGVIVNFTYGKGDTKREMTGQILGRKDPAEGEKGSALLKVASGAGYDAVIVTIYPAQVTSVVTPAQEQVAA